MSELTDSLLKLVAEHGTVEMMEWLLDNGCNPMCLQAESQPRESLLVSTILSGRDDMTNFLALKGFKANKEDYKHLQAAMSSGRFDVARDILTDLVLEDNGIPRASLISDVVHILASLSVNADLLKLFIGRSRSIGFMPTHVLSNIMYERLESNDETSAAMMIECGADVNYSPNMSSLAVAISNKMLDISLVIITIMEEKISEDIGDGNGRSVISMALDARESDESWDEALSMMIKNGARIDVDDVNKLWTSKHDVPVDMFMEMLSSKSLMTDRHKLDDLLVDLMCRKDISKRLIARLVKLMKKLRHGHLEKFVSNGCGSTLHDIIDGKYGDINIQRMFLEKAMVEAYERIGVELRGDELGGNGLGVARRVIDFTSHHYAMRWEDLSTDELSGCIINAALASDREYVSLLTRDNRCCIGNAGALALEELLEGGFIDAARLLIVCGAIDDDTLEICVTDVVKLLEKMGEPGAKLIKMITENGLTKLPGRNGVDSQ